MQEANQKRVNRVYKSLHKPLTYLGIERSLFFIICVSAVGLFNIFNSILAGTGTDAAMRVIGDDGPLVGVPLAIGDLTEEANVDPVERPCRIVSVHARSCE